MASKDENFDVSYRGILELWIKLRSIADIVLFEVSLERQIDNMFLLASSTARSEPFVEQITYVRIHLSEVPPLHKWAKDIKDL